MAEMEEVLKAMGIRIMERRKKMGLTQEALAEAMPKAEKGGCGRKTLCGSLPHSESARITC